MWWLQLAEIVVWLGIIAMAWRIYRNAARYHDEALKAFDEATRMLREIQKP